MKLKIQAIQPKLNCSGRFDSAKEERRAAYQRFIKDRSIHAADE